MRFQVYILYSPALDKFYKGQTSDLELRVQRHNAGYEKSTRSGIPWILIWSTNKETRKEALILEKKLKNLSRARLIAFTQKYGDGILTEGRKILAQVSRVDP